MSIYHKPGERPTVIACYIFNGRSPVTGRRVWSRHRWDGGKWGAGRCVYCGRTLDQVMTTLEPKK